MCCVERTQGSGAWCARNDASAVLRPGTGASDVDTVIEGTHSPKTGKVAGRTVSAGNAPRPPHASGMAPVRPGGSLPSGAGPENP